MLTLACAQRPGQLAERPGPVLDVDDQNIALVGDPHPRVLERAAGRARLLVVDEDVDDPPSLVAGERAHPQDVDAGRAGHFAEPRQLAGPILEDYGQILWHLASGEGV